ncbi:MAG: ABC transporter permease [Acidobacteriota bacterium]
MTAAGSGVVLRLFLKNSQVQPKRAFLTIAAIAWGALALLLLLAFGEGLQRTMTSARAAMGNNLAVIWPGDTSRPWNGLPTGRPVQVNIDDLEILRSQIQGHAGFSGEVRRWGLALTANGKTVSNQVTGAEAIFGELRNQIPARGGRFINERDVLEQRRVIFLGDQLAKDLFGTTDCVGRVIEVEDVPYTVIGVLKHRLQMGNYSGPDDNRAVIPMSTFRAQFGQRRLENLILRAPSPQAMPALLAQFRQVLARRFQFDPEDERVFGIWDTVETNKVFGNVILGIKSFLAIIGMLTLTVGGVGVANIMYAVVKERTRDIGVQMALGARPAWITGPIVLEAVTYTMIGGAIGILLAVLIVFGISFVPTEGNEALQFLGKPTLSLEIGILASAILGLIGFFAGYIPARRASRIDPAQTLRYE